MLSKKNKFKMLEGRIETMQILAVECIEMIYNEGYNEAVEEAAKIAERLNEINFPTMIVDDIRSLKK